MGKNKIFIAISIILLVIVLGLLFYIFTANRKLPKQTEKPYYAVYLNTGDVYFGRLRRFPRLILTDVHLLQREADNGFSLRKFGEAIYGPENKIEINRKSVVWITKLSPDSQVVQIIEGKQPSAISQ